VKRRSRHKPRSSARRAATHHAFMTRQPPAAVGRPVGYAHENSIMGWLSGLATLVGLAGGAYYLYSVLHPPFGQSAVWGVTQFAQQTPGTYQPAVGQFAVLEDIASGAGVIVMVTALGTAPDGQAALTGQVEQIVAETSTPSGILPGQTVLAHVTDVILTGTSDSTIQTELSAAISKINGGASTTTTTQSASTTQTPQA
jgi:hypothetical protein